MGNGAGLTVGDNAEEKGKAVGLADGNNVGDGVISNGKPQASSSLLMPQFPQVPELSHPHQFLEPPGHPVVDGEQ